MTLNQTCKNCNNLYSGHFCNGCGQKTVHRITLGHIGHDMVHAFTHADKGIFHLLLKMFVKPGIVAREYIVEGKRKRYFTPFQYILIVITISAIVAANTQFIEGATQAFSNNAGYSARQLAFMQKVNSYQNKYYNFMILMQLPFYAIATAIMYKKYRYNFAEHLTLQTFISAQVTVISMLIMLSIFVSGKPSVLLISLMLFITTSFQVFAFMQFFDEISFKGFLKALLANIIGFLFFVLFVAIAVVIYGLTSNAFAG